MSDDKRLKSTEIIYNDRAPTEVTPDGDPRGGDAFRQNLLSPNAPASQPPAAPAGNATQIHFGGAAASAPAGDPGAASAETSAAVAAIAAAFGMPAHAVQQLIAALPHDQLAKLAVTFGIQPHVIEQIQGALQNPQASALPAGFGTARPTTGWLVVIKGPGRGNSLPLTFGRNEVGRDADQDVPLVFGDEQISRRNQLAITYDPRSGKFLCSPGESTRNLCYISGEPLVTPLVLAGTTNIEVGATTLRFVPLCDETFEWTPEEA